VSKAIRSSTTGKGRRARGQRVTLRTVAASLGLSVTTVSRALKEGPEVNRATIEQVKAAARALGYRPNLGGLNLRTGKTHAIGIVLPFERQGEMNIVVSSLVEAVSRRMKAIGYRTIAVPQLQADDPLTAVRDLVEEGSVDGVIITHTRPQDDRVKYLLEADMPFVTFGRTELLSIHPSLDIDHEMIGVDAARLLLDAGHRCPLLIAPSSQFTYSLQFVKGWSKTFTSRHLTVPDNFIHFTATTPDSGQELAMNIVDWHPGATGAFVASEEAALGFLAGLRSRGRLVGRNFGLVTYGGTNLHDFFNPPISAFHFSNYVIGERLAALLERALAGEDPAILRQVVKAGFVDHHSQGLFTQAS
jgi:LacI family transcriptional regulator